MHPEISQLNQSAEEPPPRLGRNFLRGCNRWFYWGFPDLKLRNRAERLANRAGQPVENPWNLFSPRSGTRAGE